MLRAGQVSVQGHPLPGGVCGVCTGCGEKEVKPVSLTVFRKETDKVSDFKIFPPPSFFHPFQIPGLGFLKANEDLLTTLWSNTRTRAREVGQCLRMLDALSEDPLGFPTQSVSAAPGDPMSSSQHFGLLQTLCPFIHSNIHIYT